MEDLEKVSIPVEAGWVEGTVHIHYITCTVREYSPLSQQVHVLTVHPSMYTELAQVAGVALLILAKQDTRHDGGLLQPQD